MELATGALFVLTTYNLPLKSYSLQNLLTLSYWLFIVSSLLVIFVYDLKHYIIPDKVVYPAIGVALIFSFQLFPILSAIGAALFFSAIVLVSKGRWMGVGDIKLAFLMGLILGFPNIITALFLAFFTGAIIGIGLIIFGKKTLKSEIPFAPFLISGIFIAYFFGEKLINWYLSLCLIC